MPVLDNPRHERFAQELAKGIGQTEAYVRAGYKENKSAASRLAENVNVCERVREILDKSAVRSEISIARVLQELGRVGLSDIREAFSEDGSILHAKDFSDEFAPAVSSIEVVQKEDQDGNIEYVHKLKLWDKNSALDKLAKHLGMFMDRVEVSGPNGGPIATDATPNLTELLRDAPPDVREWLRKSLEK